MNSVKAIPPGAVNSFRSELRRAHPKYSLMLSVGLDTGLRVSDILLLRVRDVSTVAPIGAELNVLEKKTQKHRTVRLSAETVQEIKSFITTNNLNPNEPLIFGRTKAKPLSRQQAWRIFASCARSVGLKSVGSHSMRKTYAKNEYAVHGDLSALQRDFGHKYDTTTAGYLISPDKIKKMLEGLINEDSE
jgi:integrase